MVIRYETPADHAAIDRVVISAFDSRSEADLVNALRTDEAWVGLSLVVEHDGQIIGHVLLTRASLDGAPALALAPVSVDPRHQGRGVGSTLVNTALDEARSRGETTVVVLGDPAYYARFGFERASRLGVTGPFGDIPEFQALALATESASGAITYAAPFGL